MLAVTSDRSGANKKAKEMESPKPFTLVDKPFDAPPVKTTTATEAYGDVLIQGVPSLRFATPSTGAWSTK